jgi:5-methylcytosine-specific restriction endonuclease McrA
MFEREPALVDFYHSKRWESTRAAYLATKLHVCERCGRPAKMVHHKTYLNAVNVNDPATALGFANLEALCQECHNREHFGTQATAEGLRFDKDGNLIVAIEN